MNRGTIFLARKVPQAHSSLTGGAWERSKFSGVELYEKTGSSLQVMIYESWYYTWVEMSATRMVESASAELKQ